jgi:ribulose-5-phosphate 4-epimerase/fuculose-1-phosphate aldolase
LAKFDLKLEEAVEDIAVQQARIDLAAAFRLAARYNWHEAIANHFSVAVNADGSKFLMNPNGMHFSRIKASDLLLLDAGDADTLEQPDAPDATAWGLHGSLHRNVPFARCALHLHPKFATALAALEDSVIPPIDQNTAMFFNRLVIDNDYSGLAFESEGERVCGLFNDPSKRTMIIGNHGVLVLGDTIGEAFNTLYYLERAAETYILALQTGKPLRIMSHNVAAKVVDEIDTYSDTVDRHLEELKLILDAEGSDYAN